MSITTRARRRLAIAIACALASGGLVVMVTGPAQAAEQSVSDVDLTWSLSDEQGGGAFAGGCNFLSAGKAGNTGSSRQWTESDGFFKATDGDVSVEKPNASDQYVATTWADRCKDKNGTTVTAGNAATTTGNRVKLSRGTGTIDAATGAATISWTGSFTSAFYGGMTYWSATDPRLVIGADGTGTLTATASGYGTTMDDQTKWVPLPPRTVTLAEFEDVDVTTLGFTATPSYLGTPVETASTPQAAKTAANEAYWGSFPQSFVDFQQETGQSSYWYTSGGARDTAKPATPVSVTIGPKVTVDKTVFQPDGSQTLTVTGTGFDPSLATGTRPPLAGRPAGAYIAVGKFAAGWRPSTGAPSTSRKTMTAAQGGLRWAVLEADQAAVGGAAGGAVTLSPEGRFTATLTVDKAQLDAIATDPGLVNYGIYTYPGSGGSAAAYETYTPITFARSATRVSVAGIPASAYGTARTANVSVTGSGSIAPTGSVTASIGGTVVAGGTLAGGATTIVLPAGLGAGTSSVAYAYSGDSNNAASSVTQSLSVSKAAVSIARHKITKKPTTRKTGRTTLSVRSAAPGAVTGTVTVVFSKKGQKTKTKTVTVRNGKASVTIPRLAKGTWRISVKYAGSANYAATSARSAGTVKVTKR
jgi:hypothetical protein